MAKEKPTARKAYYISVKISISSETVKRAHRLPCNISILTLMDYVKLTLACISHFWTEKECGLIYFRFYSTATLRELRLRLAGLNVRDDTRKGKSRSIFLYIHVGKVICSCKMGQMGQRDKQLIKKSSVQCAVLRILANNSMSGKQP